MKHRTAWTLLFGLLLQLLAGSAWAWRGPQTTKHSGHCQDTVVQIASAANAQHAESKNHAGPDMADPHHCCTVGVGMAIETVPQPLPQAMPTSQQTLWASLSLRPEQRPPI